MKGIDICILAWLSHATDSDRARPTSRIARDLGLSTSRVHESLQRLYRVKLVHRGLGQVVTPSYLEFLEHGIRYVMPVDVGGPERGIPTDISADPLRAVFDIGGNELPRVWAHPDGTVQGLATPPLHPCVPSAAMRDARFYQHMALVDGCRLETPRIRREAIKLLHEHMHQGPGAS